MINLFMPLADFISNQLIKLLDKFKFQNPIAYGFVVAILIYFWIQLDAGNIVIPDIKLLANVGIDNVNAFVKTIMFVIASVIVPHTAEKLKKANEVK